MQEAQKARTRLGLVEIRTIGRAGIHTINGGHAFVAPLRALVDPIAPLKAAISEVIGSEVRAVILIASIARGDPGVDSDIDLAVIAAAAWDKRVELHDTVRTRRGNDCDVLLFTESEFRRRATEGEPVVSEVPSSATGSPWSAPSRNSIQGRLWAPAERSATTPSLS